MLFMLDFGHIESDRGLRSVDCVLMLFGSGLLVDLRMLAALEVLELFGVLKTPGILKLTTLFPFCFHCPRM
jgi:hypothetical protein